MIPFNNFMKSWGKNEYGDNALNKEYDVCLTTLDFGNLTYDIAAGLSGKGLRVVVITQCRSYIVPAQKSPSFEQLSGFDIHRLELPKLNKNNAIHKLLMYWAFARKTVKLADMVNAHVFFVVFPPFFAAYHLLRLSLRRKKSFALILHDLHPDTVIRRKQISKYNPLAILLKRQTAFLMQNSTKIIVLGRDVSEYLAKEYKVLPNKMSYIPNWGRNLPESLSVKNLFPQCSKYPFWVVYSGNFGEASDFDTLFNAIQILEKKDTSVCFIFVGTGRKKRAFQDNAQNQGLSNVFFSDFLPESEYYALLKRASVFLVTLRDSSKGMSVPSKYYSYLSASKPVLAIVPEFSEVWLSIQEDGLGEVCPNGQVDSVVEKLLKLRHDDGYYSSICENVSRVFEKKYNQKVLTNRYYELFREIHKTQY